MVWLPRNAQKCIFFTPFSPFLAKKIFFSKIRLRQFFGTIESYLDAKNQKKLWSRSSGIHPDVRTDGRTDGRTDEGKSIVPPKFLGRSNKKYATFITFLAFPCRLHIPLHFTLIPIELNINPLMS